MSEYPVTDSQIVEGNNALPNTVAAKFILGATVVACIPYGLLAFLAALSPLWNASVHFGEGTVLNLVDAAFYLFWSFLSIQGLRGINKLRKQSQPRGKQ